VDDLAGLVGMVHRVPQAADQRPGEPDRRCRSGSVSVRVATTLPYRSVM
jgi:hypothetical protein